MLKKILKILLALIVLLAITFGIGYAIYNEPLPVGSIGPEADALAVKMQKSLNYRSFKRTRFLEWSFRNGKHTYFWDKERNVVNVSWDGFIVNLNLSNRSLSMTSKNNKSITGVQRNKLIEKAFSLFNNDSFWLIAPFKVFDKGTTRSLVPLGRGENGLLVTYSSGGDTPGDSYLWKLGSNGFPESYQMWVKILPIGGLEATWDNWQIMESGVFLPKSHKLGPISLDMGDVKAYQ